MESSLQIGDSNTQNTNTVTYFDHSDKSLYGKITLSLMDYYNIKHK